jgi:hypothetical protein
MTWDSPGVATLYAFWGSEPLTAPSGFSMDTFKVPDVSGDADRQRLAGMLWLRAASWMFFHP